MPRALLSVSDKSGLAEFARVLVDQGFDLLSTGGTHRFLSEAGFEVMDVASYTQFPEMMGGRVKTLHPKVHGALLGRRDNEGDLASMQEHGIVPIDMVVVNLYPFEETVARDDVTLPEAIEQIDIGGPSMIRSAAKNHQSVTVVTDPKQYEEVATALKNDTLDLSLRRKLATAAFLRTAEYDHAINAYLTAELELESNPEAGSDIAEPLPEVLSLSLGKRADLRYGENPHQSAAFYTEPEPGPSTLAAAEQLHGKELSYNNLLDLDAALNLIREFEAPAVAVLKHTNPCGCGIGDSLAEAFERAYAGDPVSAFGSIMSFNRIVDAATAEILCEPNRFVEAIIAPGFDPAALELITTKPTWRKNVRLMRLPGMMEARERDQRDYRRLTGGLLVQDRDEGSTPVEEWQVVTERAPSDGEQRDLEFAWRVCKHVKSNAIVFAKDQMITGVGAGQMSRLDSSMIAARKSEGRCADGVCASDAFFPFRDGVDQAAEAGIKAIVQPGGSKRDDEVIEACNEHGIAMLFTGRRHFRH
ncbi:bifunctional phosphoribosylaminoimidazolecarboxamide formyltransferase/IMP cyclohydrolase [Calycomorphotria hydatis]|uniref:Bifunctional purine biosynthesis protein PurH n=1 Tax=Calycomorphotria hydatis TaxID=2528027 RepID=A0A517TET6_9PLAN|nr:bifunctional phosphoribosylaminoimidazolecarboxamide formyltransferase/IMP cyclohydrolase [Calycomorphotria hydatis]QDT66888.1 Bifunctional purine biosynthesis protein PurH [Calycomorphotria hydatis]